MCCLFLIEHTAGVVSEEFSFIASILPHEGFNLTCLYSFPSVFLFMFVFLTSFLLKT